MDVDLIADSACWHCDVLMYDLLYHSTDWLSYSSDSAEKIFIIFFLHWCTQTQLRWFTSFQQLLCMCGWPHLLVTTQNFPFFKIGISFSNFTSFSTYCLFCIMSVNNTFLFQLAQTELQKILKSFQLKPRPEAKPTTASEKRHKDEPQNKFVHLY